jgi:ABC-2 type transport system ATP-binding protein
VPAAITLDRLSKRYGPIRAIDDLTFDVLPGEVFGFLGLNGAGKTTTIRLLLDLLRPTSGRALVLGLDCRRRGIEARAQVGYLPGELGFLPDMTGLQVVNLLARLGQHAVDRGWRTQLLDRLRLSPSDLARRIREYSSGMKRKLGIVQAFQHDPPLLVLDEPTEGLDPLMQEEFFTLVEEVTRRGRTVFLSSHVLSEVERSCHRVALLREGRLALLAPVGELRALAPRTVRVVFAGPAPVPPSLPPGLVVSTVAANSWEVQASGPIGPLVQAVSSLDVTDVEVRSPRLEEVLSRYYRRQE